MKSNSPLSIIGDKIIITPPFVLQEMTNICIVSDVVIIIFTFILYSIKDSAPDVIYFLSFLWVIAIIVNILAFGFRSKLIFDTKSKIIINEGTNLFAPYQKTLCNFSDIEIIGVKGYISKNKQKNSTIYFYELVYATKQDPLEFKVLAQTGAVTYNSNLNELNKMGELLSKTVNCQFLKGKESASITGSVVGAEISYTLGSLERTY